MLKRFGAANPAPLSFPTPGWTLALDIPAAAAGPGRAAATASTTSCSTPVGATTSPRTATRRPTAIRRGYPRLAEWQAVRDRVDPARVWASDQSRRLRLLDD